MTLKNNLKKCKHQWEKKGDKIRCKLCDTWSHPGFSTLNYCRETGLPYSPDEIEWRQSIMRGWVEYGNCPICGKEFELHSCWNGEWGDRRHKQ